MVLAFVAADFIFANGIGTGEVLLTVITLAVIGAVVGAIHGAALVWLLRFHRKPG
jgi:NhaP-type Na+/H+ or K+/H+ antiporter